MLIIYTTNERFEFNGVDAELVYKSVDGAGARGANWTTPIQLESGNKIVFVLSNIVAMEFK